MVNDEVTEKDVVKMDPSFRISSGGLSRFQFDCEICGHTVCQRYIAERTDQGGPNHGSKTAAEEMDHFRKIARLQVISSMQMRCAQLAANQKRYVRSVSGKD